VDGHARGDRGSFAVELAVVAPALFGLVALLISVGRVAETRAVVEGAARDAARAASINHAGTARAAAEAAARRAVGDRVCERPELDPGRPEPGQLVTARISCRVTTVWGTRTVTRAARSITDIYRSVE
jgi:TadE-like protein